MTNQIQGEILFKGIDSTLSDWVYTPWIPVDGDEATFAIEILEITSGITITWNAETRTLEDPTAHDYYSSAQTTSSVGVDIGSGGTAQDLNELVRYKFATGGTASATEWAILRALEPSWQSDRV